ncbi:hypothetical protein [Pseudoroseomonas cervicalis]|uniref:hypothetical protein n=1 Tax=Teichococcus cervicalis TaxID=204525 RepID=UPI00277D3530|nr:hypothetical protein [Pseudoroseomonas cervicalis]MDQ1078009.1 hypothetical protein [Pseudoroseomonas cervicalis]
MFRLTLSTAPRWLELSHGIRVEVRPLTTAIVEAAAAEALKRVAAIQVEAQAAEKAGQPLDSTAFNGANSSALDGMWNQHRAEALARYGIIRWEGLAGDDGGPLPVSPAAIEAFAAHPVLAKEFIKLYAQPVNEVVEEGNGSAPSSDGSTEGAESTAEAVPDGQTESAAPDAEPAPASPKRRAAQKDGRS